MSSAGDYDIAAIRAHIEEVQHRLLNVEKQNRYLASSLSNGNLCGSDIAWMLAATALVYLMTLPGLSLYYAGMAPKKQSLLTTAMQGFSITCLVTITWLFFGYSLSFSPGSPVLGGYTRFFLVNLEMSLGHPKAPTIPETLFCAFQLGFAVVTATIFCGASADRMKFYSLLVIVALWHLIVYCPVAHSNWHFEGFLYEAGVLDYAGGNVVHVSSGMSGIISSYVIGKRYDSEHDQFVPNNMLYTITGACLLWIGWFGFNAGSSYGADEQAAMALLMTQIATSTAAFSWISMEYFGTKLPTVLGMVNGAVAGLIAITPAAGYVDATGAFFIGLLSGPVCYFGIRLKKYMGLDDALDAFGLHGIAGIYGGIMTGLFAKNFGGLGAFYGNPKQIGIQLYGILITSCWSLLMTFLILQFVDFAVGIRISLDTEKAGLDRSLHGEGLYAERTKTVTPSQRVAELLQAYAEAKAKAGDAEEDNQRNHKSRRRPYHDGPISEDSSLTSSVVDPNVVAKRRAAVSAKLDTLAASTAKAILCPPYETNDEKPMQSALKSPLEKKDFDRRSLDRSQKELIIGDLVPPPPPVSEPKKVHYEKIRDATVGEDD